MPSPITYVKVTGKTAGSDLVLKLQNLNNVSISNAFRNIGKWFEGVGMGVRTFNGTVMAGGAQASNTETAGVVVNGNTVVINGVTFTAAASVTTNVTYLSGTGSVAAISLANAINGNTGFGAAPAKVAGVVYATVSGAVVTITAFEPGTIGNIYTLTQSANWTIGSGVTLLNGVDGTITNIAKGI